MSLMNIFGKMLLPSFFKDKINKSDYPHGQSLNKIIYLIN